MESKSTHSEMRLHGMRFLRVTTTVLVALALLAAPSCKSRNTPNIERRGAVTSTGTVQAELPTSTAETTTSAGGASATSSGTTAAKPGQGKPKPAPTIWPTKLGQFASVVNSPIWYPKTLAAGWKTDSVDVIELDKGTGLVCDIVFLRGGKALVFTQGSPKERSYAIASSQKVAWGSETADVVHQDPADSSSPVIIVYNRGGNFAELQGDASLAELKAIAKGMVPVK